MKKTNINNSKYKGLGYGLGFCVITVVVLILAVAISQLTLIKNLAEAGAEVSKIGSERNFSKHEMLKKEFIKDNENWLEEVNNESNSLKFTTEEGEGFVNIIN